MSYSKNMKSENTTTSLLTGGSTTPISDNDLPKHVYRFGSITQKTQLYYYLAAYETASLNSDSTTIFVKCARFLPAAKIDVAYQNGVVFLALSSTDIIQKDVAIQREIFSSSATIETNNGIVKISQTGKVLEVEVGRIVVLVKDADRIYVGYILENNLLSLNDEMQDLPEMPYQATSPVYNTSAIDSARLVNYVYRVGVKVINGINYYFTANFETSAVSLNSTTDSNIITCNAVKFKSTESVSSANISSTPVTGVIVYTGVTDRLNVGEIGIRKATFPASTLIQTTGDGFLFIDGTSQVYLKIGSLLSIRRDSNSIVIGYIEQNDIASV